MKWLARHWTVLLLSISLPAAGLLQFLSPEQRIAIFVASAIAIVPLASIIGGATETLARHLGGGFGGLLNATFGNVAELIIGLFALRRGLTDLVVSLGGSLSGEHGDGQSRGELLTKMYGPELMTALREFKTIWDPDWRMNPGKVIPDLASNR